MRGVKTVELEKAIIYLHTDHEWEELMEENSRRMDPFQYIRHYKTKAHSLPKPPCTSVLVMDMDGWMDPWSMQGRWGWMGNVSRPGTLCSFVPPLHRYVAAGLFCVVLQFC